MSEFRAHYPSLLLRISNSYLVLQTHIRHHRSRPEYPLIIYTLQAYGYASVSFFPPGSDIPDVDQDPGSKIFTLNPERKNNYFDEK